MEELEKDFVPHDRALRMKALGFIERVLTYFEDGNVKTYDKGTMGWDFNNSFLSCVSRPTFSQAFRWFRKKYDLHLLPIRSVDKWYSTFGSWIASFESYEQAELACLDKLIEIVEGITELN